MPEIDIISELKRLFDLAKRVDEFEFINILIGYNGMGDQRFLSHLYESERLINEVENLMDKATDKHTKTRLGLLLYGHIFEMDELYNVLGNLLRIATAQGLRYIPDLYNRFDQDDITPTEKLKRLLEHGVQCRFEDFIIQLQSLYYNRIRNAFAHSSYSLIDDEFIIIKGKEVEIEGTLKRSVSLDDFLLPTIKDSLSFINEFFSLLKEHKMSYKSNKVIQGSLSNIEPIMILGNPEDGLIGFESFSGSSIKIKNAYGTDRFIEAMNIRLTNTSDANKALLDEIESYNEKKKPSGANFEDLKNRVLATGEKQLIRNLSVVVYNYANDTFKAGEAKPLAQKEYIMKAALSYYDMAISLDSTYGRPYLNRALSKLKLANFNGTINNQLRRQLLEDLKEALKYEPTMFEVFSNSGMLQMEIAFEEKETDKKEIELYNAIENFKKGIELYPNDDIVYERLATSHWELANISDSNNKENFEKSIENIEIAIQKNDKLSHNLLLASILGEYGDFDEENFQIHYDKAIEILKKLEDKYGVNTEIKYRLGNKYMSLSLHLENLEYCEKAFIEYNEVKKINESDINTLNNIGFCLLHKSRLLKDKEAQTALNDSISILEEVLEKDNSHSNTYINLGVAYIEKHKASPKIDELFLEKAIGFLEKAETLDNGCCSIQVSRAYSLKGDIANSILWLQKSLDSGEVFEKDDIINNEDFNNIKNDESLNKIFEKE